MWENVLFSRFNRKSYISFPVRIEFVYLRTQQRYKKVSILNGYIASHFHLQSDKQFYASLYPIEIISKFDMSWLLHWLKYFVNVYFSYTYIIIPIIRDIMINKLFKYLNKNIVDKETYNYISFNTFY